VRDAILVALGTIACLCAEFLATDAQSVIRGQASYRERIALPPDAVFEATLLDVSRADAKAEVLGSVRIEKAGQIPIRFEIAYDSAKVDERHAYAVRARILGGERTLFTTDKVYPVLTRGAGKEVDLLLVRARGAAGPAATPVPLEGTRWVVRELNGKPVPASLPQEPHLIFQADSRRVSGSGGCNRLTGGFERDGDRLDFSAIARTGAACIGGGMDTDDAMAAGLGRVRRVRLSGRRLDLLDEAGATLITLEAASTP
jgi:putative lipoprotein